MAHTPLQSGTPGLAITVDRQRRDRREVIWSREDMQQAGREPREESKHGQLTAPPEAGQNNLALNRLELEKFLER